MPMDFSAILYAAQLEHASDVHVCADAPIRARIAGRLKVLAVPILSSGELHAWLMAQFTPAQHEVWSNGEQVDFALFDNSIQYSFSLPFDFFAPFLKSIVP